MTQILSVSATTAGYISDTLKPINKTGRSTYVEQINRQISVKKDIAKTQGISRTAIETLRDSSAIGLHFMKAGENKQPRASLEETKQAYQETEDAASANG